MLDVVQPMSLQLKVVRTIFTDKSTIGTLFVSGAPIGTNRVASEQQFCYTLEPPKREEKPRCIPVGLYDVTIRMSAKHKRLMPHVEHVPGFEGIEIHTGNYPKDTEGCLLVAETHAPDVSDFIGNSANAFQRLFILIAAAIDKGEQVYITYTEIEGATNEPKTP